jgi:1,4-dihydroxy-2-naphthoate octaprenyltransferase
MHRLLLVLRLSRPLNQLLAALTYVLGAGIARYLGRPVSAPDFWLGLAGVMLTVMSLHLLAEVFRPANEPIVGGETSAERLATRAAALYLALAALACLALIALLLIRDGHLGPGGLVDLGLSLIFIILYAVPPVRLCDKGFGELILAIQIAYLSASIGFLIQVDSYRPVMLLVTLPLSLLLLAMFLALDFPAYAGDMKYERRSLLARLGWERALPLHHTLLLLAYILLAAAPVYGFSLRLIWPALLSLPFAMLQIFWLRNIGLGARPMWSVLTANAIAIFGLTTYLLTAAFWLH